MVEIKNLMNAQQDLQDTQAKLDAGTGDSNELFALKSSLEDTIGELEPIIAALNEETTSANAIALTIESTVADIEANIRLGAANAELARLDAENKNYQS